MEVFVGIRRDEDISDSTETVRRLRRGDRIERLHRK
jgi:hypothetical protein